MGCKCAPACRQALDDATRRWPKRNKASDGCCGDAAHAKRKSDHNPDASGFAHAYDLTDDPANGVNCDLLVHDVIKDPRVTYVIWQGRIWKARTKQWEVYRGPNPHNHHMHVSIYSTARNDLRPWPWSMTGTVILQRGSSDAAKVTELQKKLKAAGEVIGIDGKFGPNTESAVKRVQKRKGLAETGMVDDATWEALK